MVQAGFFFLLFNKFIKINRLKELRTMSTLLYNKLEDWLEYTSSVENNAVHEMTCMLRVAIE